LILILTAFHAIGLRASKWTQNSLVLLKGGLVLGFVTLGLLLGDNRWPTWEPPSPRGEGAASFATSLLFVAYAFSGWNAVAYAAEEVDDPRRNVPRAMLIGCGIVGIAYVAVNWILVTNLTPERAEVVFEYEEAKVTLGHLVARDLLGDSGSSLMSLGIALMLVSSTSAMLLVGPRVCAEMARDGFLPRWFSGSTGAPPRASIVLQGALALALLHLHTVGELLSNVAGILVLFSGLVAGGLFLVRRRRPDLPPPRRTALVAAAVYVGFAGWMLYGAFEARAGLFPWLAAAIIAALLGYAGTRSSVS
jgi:APA family basic amino acid/polyamine antiporter